MEMLSQYDWPGNVRELQNMIERAVVLTREERLTPKSFNFPYRPRKTPHVQDEISIPEQGLSLAHVVEDLEKAYIKKALTLAEGVQTRAADLLQVTRKILRYKIDKYGL